MVVTKIYRSLERFLILALIIVAVSLYSCSDDYSSNSHTAPQYITFTSPVLRGISRVVTDVEQGGHDAQGNAVPYSNKETFRVFGVRYNNVTEDVLPWRTPSSLEFGTDGEISSYNPEINGWETVEHHLWKSKTLYAFAAYSPGDISAECVSAAYNDAAEQTNGLKIKGYTTPEMGSQYDLMYAPAVYDKTNTPASAVNGNAFYNGVNLKFNHALASVHFYVCIHPDYIRNIPENMRPDEAAKFKITGISISGVYGTADFNENCSDEKSGGSWHYVPGIPDEPSRTGFDLWSEYKNLSLYEFVGTPVTNIPQNEKQTIQQTAADVKSLNDKNHIGFMIPQQITDNAVINISWTYDTGIKGIDAEKNSKSIKINSLTKTWKMGYRYVYTIALERDRIKVVPSVDDITSGEINIE